MPDISYSVKTLSQIMHKPKRSCMESVMEVNRYIKSSPGLGLVMSSNNKLELSVYFDSDWASCPMSRRSSKRYCIKLRVTGLLENKKIEYNIKNLQPKLNIGLSINS